ncbi:MAG: hypothetical protein IJ419_09750 [Agathobacter sp.]|nr:hypothetical protein [Agathobacter sp.]
MKRFVCCVLILVLALSLCACGEKRDYQGNTIEAENGEVILQQTGEFVVSKLHKGDYYTSNVGHRSEYTAVISNDEFAALIVIHAEQYAIWEDGDIITGTLKAEVVSGYDYPLADFIVGEDNFNVSWYGKK